MITYIINIQIGLLNNTVQKCKKDEFLILNNNCVRLLYNLIN